MPTAPSLVPVSRELSADTITPIAAYRALAQPGASCLLESVDSGGSISRYSFIGLDYRASTSLVSSAEVIDAVRAYTRENAPGGALVAFAYDAARAFARLGARKPAFTSIPDVYVAAPATWLTFDHFTDRVTMTTYAPEARDAARRLDEISSMLYAASPSAPQMFRAYHMRQSIDRDRYLALVAQVKKHIVEGDVYQLQLGIRFLAEMEGAPLDLYRALRSRNPSPYMFFVDTPFGQLLGASPEFLVRLDGRTAQLRPLAGTRPRGTGALEDARIAGELLANEKERAEHVMLVDLGRNDLGAVCEPGSVYVDELMRIERYSHVMHMVSNVRGTLAPAFDALDLFAAAFPAGTVTGTPKMRAMQLIDELEPTARGFYAGSVGRLSPDGVFDSCITLRSAHVANGTVAWQASAGIVADSEAAAEYDEVLHKTAVMRSVLGLQ